MALLIFLDCDGEYCHNRNRELKDTTGTSTKTVKEIVEANGWREVQKDLYLCPSCIRRVLGQED